VGIAAAVYIARRLTSSYHPALASPTVLFVHRSTGRHSALRASSSPLHAALECGYEILLHAEKQDYWRKSEHNRYRHDLVPPRPVLA
jgi:hypothetical protein